MTDLTVRSTVGAVSAFAAIVGTAVLLLTPVSAARSATLQTLSPTDARLYATAFGDAERGDYANADQTLAKVSDPCLVGRVEYLQLVAPSPRKASFVDLVGWLKAFKDLPGAETIYALALKLKPPGAQVPTPISALNVIDATSDPLPEPHAAPAARQAYYSGDMARALPLATASGDLWIAGLAAYRLSRYDLAMDDFWAVARDPGLGDDKRAAGAFWASRAARMAGQPDRENDFLRAAATLPGDFYGMIAQRRLDLTADPVGALLISPTSTDASLNVVASGLDAPRVMQLVQTNPRARRAVALMQISRPIDAGLELRTGIALAQDDTERAAWMTLARALAPDQRQGATLTDLPVASRLTGGQYPTPDLQPIGGYTLNKALVYALTWQESRFDPLAVSPAGAIGLMQVMPASAAEISADPVLKDDPTALFDPPTNLRLGQDYVTWLMQRAVGPDLLRVVAAYNAGPAALERTEKAVGVDDSLLIVESMPARETRDYVHRVMTAYWSYRRQFGAHSATLDALSGGATLVDASLDR